MADVEACRAAVAALATTLSAVEPELRARHVPRRTVSCRVTDLDLTFTARLDEHGVHDIAEYGDDAATSGGTDDAATGEPAGRAAADLRVAMASDVLCALADGRDDFLHAWMRGRLSVSASVRDLLRLRSLLGL